MPKIYLTEAANTGPLHLFIATSGYQFFANYTHSLAAGCALLANHGIPFDLCHIDGHCHVDDARNSMVRQFLMSKSSHLVFIDNDVGFTPETILILANHDAKYDMVAGVYPLKEPEEGYPVQVKGGVELWSNKDGLVEVEGLPTGFLRLSRRCIDKMIDVYGDRKFYGRGQSHDDPPHYILFERTFENDTRYSGDYAFCEKWKLLGGKLYVDPDMEFTHAGTHEWSGNLGNYWRRIYGVVESRFDEAISRMKDGRFDAETVAWLIDGWGNNYAANINTLVTAWHTAKNAKNILETGPGLTTLVMALANPDAHITSLESEPDFSTHLREKFLKYCNNITVFYSPLAGGWYETICFDNYDLVLLDGPDRQKGNRNLAFDKIPDILAQSTVIMDDANDEGLLKGFSDWCTSQGREYALIGMKEKTTAISLLRKNNG